MAEKQRIEYIDLMKGIAILFIVIVHCHIAVPEPFSYMLFYVRIPLYIFLSGLFFSTYGSFKRLIVKKTNRLLLPFVSFNLIFLALLPFFNNACTIKMIKGGIFALIRFDISFLNSSLWFLILLFLMALMTFGYEKVLKNRSKIVKLAIAFIISFFAYECNTEIWSKIAENDFPKSALYKFHIMPLLILFPLYYMAYLFRDKILCPHKPLYIWLLLPVALIMWWACAEGPTWYLECYFTRNYLKLWAVQLSGISVIYFISYMVKRLPYVSYLGRYSLIVLCTHMMVHAFMRATLHIYDERVICITILVISPLLIWLLKRYLPHFTAQKELIKIQDNGKVKISFVD
ncbi:MAG: acyltransferase family protein [Muribaculaceae bacterium]